MKRCKHFETIKLTTDDAFDGNYGACGACGALIDGIEPDAYGDACPECGRQTAMGIECAVLEGFIEICDD